MKNSTKPVVAVDVGGTKFIAAVIDKDGKILSRVYRPTYAEQGPKKVIERLAATIHQAVKESGAGMKGISGISLAIAGIIDINHGVITEAPNLPDWHNIRLDDLLQAKFNIPVFLLNDASAAALGESCFGAGIGIGNMIYMTVSTGIGGGLILNGKLYNGADGSAAEIGHMIVLADGPLCKCGQHGCLEALASGTAIACMARERVCNGEKSIMLDMVDGIPASITAEHVTVAGRKRDILALSVICEAAYYLGIGLSNLVNLFNPQMIVIGGGVSTMGEMLLRPARKSMKDHAFKLPASTVRVVKSKLNPDAGILGAAAYAQQKVGGRK
jgi:glucokinase